MTKEQAVALAQSDWWVGKSSRDIAMFQLHEPLLCMPFFVFHKALEEALKRPVFTHEFGLNWKGLQRELRGETEQPSMEQILGLIPKDKRLLILGV
jgi:hypothetical protein